MKIIDLLCLISNGEEVPKTIKMRKDIYEYQGDDYMCKVNNKEYWLFSDGYTKYNDWFINFLNTEVEILDEEDDNDIPLIPDDELYKIIDKAQKGICEYENITHHVGIDVALNYNFKVLKEKINQVVEEFNEYRKEEK